MSNRLEALRVFIVAANSTNFREAAVKLAVSPQVVSRVIRELEDDLGEPLFHRNTHGVQLTSFGAQFTERARAALGGKFDLAGFNDALVTSCGVPLTVLPVVIDRYIAKQQKA